LFKVVVVVEQHKWVGKQFLIPIDFLSRKNTMEVNGLAQRFGYQHLKNIFCVQWWKEINEGENMIFSFLGELSL